MKKSFLSILTAFLLLTAILSACAEENVPYAEFELDAYCENGSMLKVCYTDGTEEETGSWGFYVELTDEFTIGNVLADSEISSIEPVCEGDEFEGWLTFEVTTVTDEDGFDEYLYTLASDTLMTTEELMALPLSENYSIYAAKWASIPAEEYYQYSDDDVEFIVIPSASLYSDGGVFTFRSEEGTYEASISAATMEPGQTFGEVLEMDDIISITKDGAEFVGWMVYEVAEMETVEGEVDAGDDPCFEVWDGWFSVLHGATVIHDCISTEELKQLTCGELDLFAVALWN